MDAAADSPAAGDDCAAAEALAKRYNCTGDAWVRCRKDEK